MARTINVLRDAGPAPTNSSASVELHFADLRRQIVQGKAWRYLLRYSEANLHTNDINLLNKPLTTAVLLRLISRGRCFFSDEQGRRLPITIRTIGKLFARMVRDLAKRPAFSKRLQCTVKSLIESAARQMSQRVRKNSTPAYLRTDLVFGLQAGGSIGHIAGVVNNVCAFDRCPVLLTSDFIPTVDEGIETHVIRPERRFRDFQELPRLYYNFTFADKARSIIDETPVSFVYQRYSQNSFSGALLARDWQAPFVLEYNGSEIWVNNNWGTPLPQRFQRLAERIEWLNLIAAQVIVVVSEALKDELVERGISDERILVNPNGVDTSVYSPFVSGETVREKYDLVDKLVLGFIGTFGKWHGAEVLADAFGRLLTKYPALRENVRLLLVGDGVTMPMAVQRLEKHGVSELCVRTGLVPQNQGPQHLAACDVFVSPHVPNPDGSKFFGSPTKLFEYMAMGKGIVASNLGQIGDVLEHGATAWLIPPADANALMLGMKRLLDDRALRDSLGRAARRTVEQSFTWKEHVRRIIEKVNESCTLAETKSKQR